MLRFILAVTVAVGVVSCGGGSFTDPRDGKTYRTVKIGKQTWMAENLNYRTNGSWCYDNDDENCAKYGRLYTWRAANVACPDGWHLPTHEEWNDLARSVGGTNRKNNGLLWEIAGGKLKSKTGWNDNGNGTDDFGFSALPGGGGFGGSGNTFFSIGDNGDWWSATETSTTTARCAMMAHHNNAVKFPDVNKSGANAVRCVRN